MLLNVIIIASGASLTDEQCKLAQEYRQAGKCKIITVNRSFEKTQSDYIVAADAQVWKRYINEIREISPDASYWCHNEAAANLYNLNHFKCLNQHKGLIKEPISTVSGGCNSGHMAINLAYQWGFKNIALIGFDYQHTGGKAHYFGNHEDPKWPNAHNPDRWIDLAKPLADDLKAELVQVTNCSIQTALECYDRDTLDNWVNML